MLMANVTKSPEKHHDINVSEESFPMLSNQGTNDDVITSGRSTPQ